VGILPTGELKSALATGRETHAHFGVRLIVSASGKHGYFRDNMYLVFAKTSEIFIIFVYLMLLDTPYFFCIIRYQFLLGITN